MPRKVSLRVVNVDLDDETALERIAAHLDDLFWSEVDGRVYVDLFVDESDLVCAAVDVACRIHTNLLGARVDEVDDDLVGIPDIALRTGLNRETIRSWVNATRGPGRFPIPVGSLGGGQRGSAKIWRWREVNEWLRSNFSLGDKFDYPSQAEIAEINAQLSQLSHHNQPSLQNGPFVVTSLNVNSPIQLSPSPHITITEPSQMIARIPASDPQHITIGSTA